MEVEVAVASRHFDIVAGVDIAVVVDSNWIAVVEVMTK